MTSRRILSLSGGFNFRDLGGVGILQLGKVQLNGIS